MNKKKYKSHYDEKLKNDKSEHKKYSKPIPVKMPRIEYAAEKIMWAEYITTFCAEGFMWRGLHMEYPILDLYSCSETWHYLDEVENPVLFEEMLYKMMEKLHKEEKIVWWKIQKCTTKRNIEYLMVRCK